jgi:hypothetical protein
VKRSHTVDLVLLLSAAATLESCSHQQCVNEHGIIVDDRYCQSSNVPGPHGYRFYNSGWFGGRVPMGGSISDSAGTTRGVFGSAGESAAHGGGGESGGE